MEDMYIYINRKFRLTILVWGSLWLAPIIIMFSIVEHNTMFMRVEHMTQLSQGNSIPGIILLEQKPLPVIIFCESN